MSSQLKRVAPIGEARDREILKDAATYHYVERKDGPQQAHVYPPTTPQDAPAPAIVFFHGGFWDTPTPSQFVPHCLHFASRGALTVAAETRCHARNGTSALEAIEDARDLIRWLRFNASALHIDPSRIIIGGSSGGALLALLATMPKEKALPPVDGLRCNPQALILFSSLIDAVSIRAAKERFPDTKSAKRHSPSRLIRRKLPPILMFHGKSDRVTPFQDAARFARRMRFWGNDCRLIDFERADHSFFNFNFSHTNFELTIHAADQFLVELGFLPPSPEPTEIASEVRVVEP